MINPEMIKDACHAEEKRIAERQGKQPKNDVLPATDWQYKPADYSDAGNAAAFSEWVDGQLLHCPALGWLVWTGQNWELADHVAVSFATQYTDAMLEDAIHYYGTVARSSSAGSQEEKTAKAYLNHAQKTRSKRSIDAFLRLSENRLYVALDDLDADGYKLNCPGGLVDLRTGRIIPSAPDQLNMKIAACAPSEQGAEEWDAFLDDVTCGDPGIKGFLQEVAGMAAVGKVLTETAVFLIGGGRNGKSTWINAVAAVLGSYSRTMDISVLTTAQQNRGTAFAELKGRRLVYAGELEQGARLSVSTLKQLCSTDKIEGQRKYHDPAEFTPSHTLIMCSNYLPRVGADDAGCWRRIQVVPFNADFTGKKEIKNYASVRVERAGGAILRWVIDGAIRFLQDGGRLHIPDTVDEATERYREAEDWLQNFIDEYCITGPGAGKVKSRTLYEQYKVYASSTGDYCRRERDFVAAMQGKGYKRTNNHNVKYWHGISLQPDNYGCKWGAG